VTHGFLQNPDRTPVTWPGPLLLGKPFPVRQPAWAWGQGSHLITSEKGAVGDTLIALLFDVALVVLLVFSVKTARKELRAGRLREDGRAGSIGRLSALAARAQMTASS
jgi:hypothetical protein